MAVQKESKPGLVRDGICTNVGSASVIAVVRKGNAARNQYIIETALAFPVTAFEIRPYSTRLRRICYHTTSWPP
jgi:hypothetical protein